MYLVLVEKLINPMSDPNKGDKLYDPYYLDTIEQAYQFHAKFPKSKIYKNEGTLVEIKAEFKEEIIVD
jgi:hypothetical protein